MSDNTNSAHERTASIDLDNDTVDMLARKHNLDGSMLIGHRHDYWCAFAADIAALARRSLTSDHRETASGAPAEQFGYLRIEDDGKSITSVADERFWTGDGKIPDGMYRIVSMLAGAAAKTEQDKCDKCAGSGMVDDGEIDCYPNGEPYENGPVKCAKDCPCCGGSGRATAAGAGSAQPEALDERALFMRAIDSTYPIPDTPHQSVAERAMAKREAFNKGWEQACAALTQQAGAAVPIRDAGQEEASTQTVPDGAAGTVEKDAAYGMVPVAIVSDKYSREGYNDEIDALLPVGIQLYASTAAIEAHNKAGKEQG